MYYLTIFERSLPAVGLQVACFMFSRLFGDIFANVVVQRFARKYKIHRITKNSRSAIPIDPSSIYNPDDSDDEMEFDMTGNNEQSNNINPKTRSHGKKHVHLRKVSHPKVKARTVDMTGDAQNIRKSQAWREAFSAQYSSFKNYCLIGRCAFPGLLFPV